MPQENRNHYLLVKREREREREMSMKLGGVVRGMRNRCELSI